MTKKVKKEVQILLQQSSPSLGNAGSLLVVRPGYARNYLIPQGMGELATPSAIKNLGVKQKELELQEKIQFEGFLKNKTILEQSSPFIIQKRIGNNNKIFGKVTPKQVIEVLEKKTSLELQRLTIDIPEIKEVGSFSVNVQFCSRVTATIKLEILPQ